MRLFRNCRPGGWLLMFTLVVLLMLYFTNNGWHSARVLGRHASSNCYKNINDSYDTQQSAYSESVTLGHGTATKTGGFIFHPHAWPAQNAPTEKICLSTFGSVDRLFWLPWLMQSWTGPISLAVYAPGVDYATLSSVLQYLRKCDTTFDARIAIHVLYPRDGRPTVMSPSIDILELNCSHPENSVQQILEHFQISTERTLAKLPQNHLRNLARHACDTPYGLVVDIDMIPTPLMFERLNLLLHGNIKCKKCALVIPIYEIDSRESLLPATKSTLLQMLFEGKARQYHVKVYDKNQGNSNLRRWETVSNADKQEVIFWSTLQNLYQNTSEYEVLKSYKEIPYREMYRIDSYEEYWEPILVLAHDAPSFDERFLGFGFCRSSLTYEMHLRGYSFRMMDEAFLSHWGFQTRSHYPPHRLVEIKENTVRYEAMKRELKARYTLTTPPQGRGSSQQGRPPLRLAMQRRPPTVWLMKRTPSG